MNPIILDIIPNLPIHSETQTKEETDIATLVRVSNWITDAMDRDRKSLRIYNAYSKTEIKILNMFKDYFIKKGYSFTEYASSLAISWGDRE